MPTLNYNGKTIEISEDTAKSIVEACQVMSDFPKESYKYYHVDDEGDITFSIYDNDGIDEHRKEIGNIFRTREEAEAHVEYLKALTRIKNYIRENDLGIEIDWKDKNQEFFTIYYDRKDKEFSSTDNYDFVESNSIPYLKSREAAQQLIDNKASDLKIVFGIK